MDSVETTLQLWHGTVTEVNNTEFTAVIVDITNPNNPNEQVVIDRKEVFTHDQDLIFPGSMFYWSIGYNDDHRCRVSQIRFRRLPALSGRELDRVKLEASKLEEIFNE